MFFLLALGLLFKFISAADLNHLGIGSTTTVASCVGKVAVDFHGGVAPYSLSVRTLLWNEVDLGFLPVADGLNLSNPEIGVYLYPTLVPARAQLFFMIKDANGTSAFSNATVITDSPGATCIDETSPFAHYAAASIPSSTLVAVNSSEAGFFQISAGDWQTDPDSLGHFQVSSNDSDAVATFSFSGVGVTFYGTRETDKGYFNLVLDGKDAFVVDQRAGVNDTGLNVEGLWSSPILPYAEHTVQMKQIGIDGRIGPESFPVLAAQEWAYAVPDEILASSLTGTVATATSTAVVQSTLIPTTAVSTTSATRSATGTISTAAAALSSATRAGCGLAGAGIVGLVMLLMI